MVKRISSVDKHVGSRVRLRRNMLDISQTTLAKAIGVTFQQVQKYEKGVNRIGAGRLQTIAQILGVPISYFYENATAPKKLAKFREAVPMSTVNEFLASSDGLPLASGFMKITNDNVRKRIVKLVVELGAPKAR